MFEDEVLRLKELYSRISQDKEKLAEENRQLRDALAQHGIPFRGGGQDDVASNPSIGHPSSASPSNSFVPASHDLLALAVDGAVGHLVGLRKQPPTNDRGPNAQRDADLGRQGHRL